MSMRPPVDLPAGPWTAERVRSELLDELHPSPRYELVDGELLVSPSPEQEHQYAVGYLLIALNSYLAQHRVGIAVTSPSDVELAADTLVQPDVYVMPFEADGRRPRQRPYTGPLLLVIEVLSPSTAGHDRLKKRRRYARAGVPEYWVVDLEARLVERSRPEDPRVELHDERIDWRPAGATAPLVLELAPLFREALDD